MSKSVNTAKCSSPRRSLGGYGLKEVTWRTDPETGSQVGRVSYWVWRGGRRRYSSTPFPPADTVRRRRARGAFTYGKA